MTLRLGCLAVLIHSTFATLCGVPGRTPEAVSDTNLFISTLVGKNDLPAPLGQQTIPDSWPWQVAVLFDHEPGCTGSIVSNDWVITAAHCCMSRTDNNPYPSEHLQIRLEVESRPVPTEATIMALPYKVAQIVIHPSYQSSPVPRNDICLLKLAEPIVFTEKVSSVCLADAIDGAAGQKCFVTGSERAEQSILPVRLNRKQFIAELENTEATPTLQYDEVLGNRLQQVEVVISDQTSCERTYQKIMNGQGLITPEMLCTEASRLASCQGDGGGGPLVWQSAPGMPFKLIGIVSWGGGCGDNHNPAVYARISMALEWIRTIMAI